MKSEKKNVEKKKDEKIIIIIMKMEMVVCTQCMYVACDER